MHLAKVIGTVTATKKYPSLRGEKMLIIQQVEHTGSDDNTPLVAIDTVQAGVGDFVYYVIGREASMALKEPFAPVDAAITGVVDQTNVEEES
jgi:ethanolamine utilization protein EutN